jgi:tetratricopeptide (TPR) repeat protein
MERKFQAKCFLVIVAAFSLIATAGCSKLKARDRLNKGVQAYKNGQFDEAIEDFKQSKDLDPSLINARLYLATAYASQYIPGAPSEDNVRMGQQAIQEFQDVLKEDPNNLAAIDGIGSILFNMGGTPYDTKKFEESKSFHKKHIELKPDDPEPYYWMGVIDWSMAYRGNKELRVNYNAKAKKSIKDDEPLPPAVRDDFIKQYGSIIDEGVADLKKAIERRPDYDDAMAYLNLLYRQKADMETSPDDRKNDLKMANELVDKVKEIKQKRMEAPPPK